MMTTPWERFTAARRRKGMLLRWMVAHSTLSKTSIHGVLNERYGYPDTPEKRAEILRLLNLGPGEPVTEADIWIDDLLGVE